MKYVSEKLAAVGASASVEASQKAREMKAAGLDVISLSSGEPDFPTPPHIAEAGIAAIRNGMTTYTDVRGIPQLREAVLRKFKRENNIDYQLENIIAGPGAKSLIGTALSASVDPGDEVIIPAPAWVSYVDITKLVGGVPVVIQTKRQFGLKLDPATLEEAITPRSRWLILNSPGNPTGSVYTREELRALGEVLLRHPDILIMSDEIYEHLLFDGSEFVSFVDANQELRERTLTLNGASKAYAMTGWRIGYAGGPVPLVKAMTKVAGQMVGPSCSISQAAAVAALDGPTDYLLERAVAYQGRRDRVMELLGGVPGLHIQKPSGAFYLFVECGSLLGATTPDGTKLLSDVDVTNWLLRDAMVICVPGAAYGLSPYFRISIAVSMPLLEDACGRIAKAIGSLTHEDVA